MPPSADLPALKNLLAVRDGSGRLTEAAFWSAWDSLKSFGMCWPLAVFVLPDGVGLQLHFQPGHDEFNLFVETKKGSAFVTKMKEDWHAEA